MEKIYYVTQDTTGRNIELTGLPFTNVNQDNIIGIINLDQKDPLYTPMDQANIVNMSYAAGVLEITLSDTVPSITAGEKLMIKLYFDDDGKASSGDVTDARDKVMGGTGYGTGKTGRSVKEVYDQIGTKDSSDGTEPTSLFGWFRRLWSQMVVGSTTYARESSVNHNSTTVITVAEDVQTKVGTNADNASDSSGSGTIFGKLRAIIDLLKNGSYGLSEIESEVANAGTAAGTAANKAESADTKLGDKDDSADDTTTGSVFARLRAIINKIGTSADASTATTLFGWIKKVWNYLTDDIATSIGAASSAAGNAASSALSAASDASDIKTAVGSKSDSAAETSSSSLFSWVKKIRDYLVGIVTTNPYAKDSSVKDGNDTAISVTKDVQGKIGAKDSSDDAEPSTLFAWFRRLYMNIQSVYSHVYDAQNTKSAVSEAASANTKIGTNSDAAVEISGSGTIFGRLRAIIDNYLDNSQYGLSKIYTDTAKDSSVKTNVGGTDYTAIGELRDNNHGLSALLAKLAQIIADIGTIQTETEILSLPNAARIDIVTPEQSSGAISNLQIHANVMYHLGDLTALSLIMVEPSDLTIYNEFVVCFFCQTGFTLQITHWDANTQVLFNSGATCEAGHYYILSVVDNLALLAKF